MRQTDSEIKRDYGIKRSRVRQRKLLAEGMRTKESGELIGGERENLNEGARIMILGMGRIRA